MKRKISFLDLVVPFICIYVAFLLIWAYYVDGKPKGDFMEALVIFTASGFFVYGVLAFFRDLHLFGFEWMLKSWRKWTKQN